MAIQATYTFEKEEIKHVIPKAYIRVIKVITTVEDVEVFKDVPPNEDNIAQVLTYDKQVVCTCVAYVYGAKEARDNHAYPLDGFTFNFKYNTQSTNNLFIQAYEKIKTLNHRVQDCIDV